MSEKTLAQLVDEVNRQSYLKSIDDDNLDAAILHLIEQNKNNLLGDLQFYCVYENTNENKRYALIHGFYHEGINITEENIDEKSREDAQLIHQKLIESKIQIDYFFIMPYFDYEDKKKTSFLAHVWTTNDLSI